MYPAMPNACPSPPPKASMAFSNSNFGRASRSLAKRPFSRQRYFRRASQAQLSPLRTSSCGMGSVRPIKACLILYQVSPGNITFKPTSTGLPSQGNETTINTEHRAGLSDNPKRGPRLSDMQVPLLEPNPPAIIPSDYRSSEYSSESPQNQS